MNYAELEIGLHRQQEGQYTVELRFNNPQSEAATPPVRGEVVIVPQDLLTLQFDPKKYGIALAERLFAHNDIALEFAKVKAAVESSELFLRVKLFVGPSAPELHPLRWELLTDPQTRLPLATSEKILFSRFGTSSNWRNIRLRAKAELRALVAVSAPRDLDKWNLAPVKIDGEIERARASLNGIHISVAGKDEPLTLNRLVDGLRDTIDILYLVCHGALTPKGASLWLQDDTGNVKVTPGEQLAQRIGELAEAPRLVVLASCESAGSEQTSTTERVAAGELVTLAPMLAEAGVSAVLAMQGKISMETVKQAMPVFFAELLKDGQIDRALAVARGSVRERPDSWMPALFMRLKGGRIWYEPGFGVEGRGDFDKWKAICAQVVKGKFIPIVGPELGEDVAGGSRELAEQLAAEHDFPLTAHERADLAKVTQFISVNQNRTFLHEVVEKGFRRQMRERLKGALTDEAKKPQELAIERCLANPDHPYRQLADLRASIYVNASYESLLYQSLKKAGRNPEAVFGAWRGVEVPKQPQPKVVAPTADTPWVYHLFGVYGKPDTLVLTEDDFFDYLIASTKLDLLLPTLVGRLMQSSLLFLGFRLDDWRFRVLFRLIVTRPGTETMKELSHVGVQVNPDEQSLADVQRARKYLEGYFRGGKSAPEISIYWGTAADFLKELNLQLARMPDDVPADETQGEDDDWV